MNRLKETVAVARTFTKVLRADPESTCKDCWEFTLEEADGSLVIRDLVITGDRGCQGHPRTIRVLLRGARLNELDVDALSEAACARDVSCGQTLSRLLRELKQTGP